MCIVAIAWQCFTDITHGSARLPVVLLSNRDEFFDRPTSPLHHWTDTPILAGRDDKSGGTWLGVNPDNGKWAIVLNVREVGQPEPKDKISRGHLVSDYLTSHVSPRTFAQQIALNRFEGFNLVLGNQNQAFIISNRGQALTSLPAGLHVFSNGQMTGQESHWAKCEKLRGRVRQEVLPLIQEQLMLENALTRTTNVDSPVRKRHLTDWQAAAFNCLRDNTKASIDNLPNTGLPPAFEQSLSSVFIESLPFKGGYGTRVSSVLAMAQADGKECVEFLSQEYLDNGVINDMIHVSTDHVYNPAD